MEDEHSVSSGSPWQRQRLLEGWLPLAQTANERYGWGLGASALEALVVAAAPRLLHAQSALDAQAILWSAYQQHVAGEGL